MDLMRNIILRRNNPREPLARRHMTWGWRKAVREAADIPTNGLTPRQVTEARALLGWSRDQLAVFSGFGSHVVSTFERTGRVQPAALFMPLFDRAAAMQAVLQDAGVEFFNHNGRSGAKLRDRA